MEWTLINHRNSFYFVNALNFACVCFVFILVFFFSKLVCVDEWCNLPRKIIFNKQFTEMCFFFWNSHIISEKCKHLGSNLKKAFANQNHKNSQVVGLYRLENAVVNIVHWRRETRRKQCSHFSVSPWNVSLSKHECFLYLKDTGVLVLLCGLAVSIGRVSNTYEYVVMFSVWTLSKQNEWWCAVHFITRPGKLLQR